ncbi:AAA family ATPase [Paenibacillus sp. 2TAB19]|uniref:AAA family ATPase n=1 Tax=Paenibacillus sp. 2TAB19 TaxID=3233003 RepID=UPI003F9572AB
MTHSLFIVTGLSGSGKTTTVPVLRSMMGAGFNVYDMDSIVVKGDYQAACNNWIRIAYFNSLSGHCTVLFGVIPQAYNLELCDYFHRFDSVHYLLLHCSNAERTKRLTARNVWTEEGITAANDFASRMFEEAMLSLQPIVDTTDTPTPIVAFQIKEWVLKHWVERN